MIGLNRMVGATWMRVVTQENVLKKCPYYYISAAGWRRLCAGDG